jgi:hypothetical protein
LHRWRKTQSIKSDAVLARGALSRCDHRWINPNDISACAVVTRLTVAHGAPRAGGALAIQRSIAARCVPIWTR